MIIFHKFSPLFVARRLRAVVTATGLARCNYALTFTRIGKTGSLNNKRQTLNIKHRTADRYCLFMTRPYLPARFPRARRINFNIYTTVIIFTGTTKPIGV